MKINDKSIALLHSEGDTLIRIYSESEDRQVALSHYVLRGKDLVRPTFIRSDMNEMNPGELLLVDKSHLKKIKWNIGVEPEVAIETVFFQKIFAEGYDFNVTADTFVYGVVQNQSEYELFYVYKPEAGYRRIKSVGMTNDLLSDFSKAYLGYLCMNENAKRVVFAHKYINGVQFYDLKDKLRKSVVYGDKLMAPVMSMNGKKFDDYHTSKHFIGMYGTSNYVYCLYSGSPDFSAETRIIAFKWNGEYVKTWRTTNQNLSKIAVDPSDQYLLGIARDPLGGFSVLKYGFE
jgi:hypothetical protein